MEKENLRLNAWIARNIHERVRLCITNGDKEREQGVYIYIGEEMIGTCGLVTTEKEAITD